MGKWLRGRPEALARYSRAIGRRILGRETRPPEHEASIPREGIRSIIIEELGRLQAKDGGITLLDLEKRLRRMAETLEALQRRIDGLGPRKTVSEADVWKEMDSLESAETLTKDERAMLVEIFRQNLALQKRTLVGEVGSRQ